MKLRALALAAALVLTAAPALAATTFSILSTSATGGRPLNGLNVDDLVTIRLRIVDGSGVFGLGASAWNYNEAVIDFDSGTSVSAINHATCIPAVGCFSGLANALINVTPGTFGSGPLSESSIGASGNRVLIFNGVGLAGTNYNAQDPGVDAVVGGGGYQVELVFRAIANGSSTIKIGTGYNGDGEVLAGGATNQDANVDIAINVPEPASFAAGLAALATVGGAVTIRRRF